MGCETKRELRRQPEEVNSSDPDVLRAALIRESAARRHAECMVKVQTGAVQLALDLLVREPDIKVFFGEFTRKLVEITESYACGVWLIDEDRAHCDLWMAFFEDRLYTRKSRDWDELTLPRESMADHLYAYTRGWTSTVEYDGLDARLPESVQAF